VRTLAEDGVDVVAFDPAANRAAERALDGSGVRFADSIEACVRDADVVVITTAWQEFAGIDPALFDRDGDRRTVIDCWRVLTPEQLAGIATYVALGEGAKAPAIAQRP
jgi:UDPglucose 6-dehydrogenase